MAENDSDMEDLELSLHNEPGRCVCEIWCILMVYLAIFVASYFWYVYATNNCLPCFVGLYAWKMGKCIDFLL
jgi:hypothetical protein